MTGENCRSSERIDKRQEMAQKIMFNENMRNKYKQAKEYMIQE